MDESDIEDVDDRATDKEAGRERIDAITREVRSISDLAAEKHALNGVDSLE